MSATELEPLICAAIAQRVRHAAARRIQEADLASSEIISLNEAAEKVAATLSSVSHTEQRALLSELVGSIDLLPTKLTMRVLLGQVHLTPSDRVVVAELALAPGLVRIGKVSRLVLASQEAAQITASSSALVRLLARAHVARDTILACSSLDEAASRLDLSRDYAAALARLSCLSPNLYEKIMEGRKPTGLGTTPLIRLPRLPSSWSKQAQLLKLA